jgi:hypothetical protein
MRSYVIERILATIPVMTVVAVFVFGLPRLAPGDPAAVIAGDYANPKDVELLSGHYRRVDVIVMRIMDGIMAIPDILLAIALMVLVNASVRNVIIALVIPEIPRVVHVVCALVLSWREQPFVEAM